MSCSSYDLPFTFRYYVTVITVHPLVIHMQIFTQKLNKIFIHENNAHLVFIWNYFEYVVIINHTNSKLIIFEIYENCVADFQLKKGFQPNILPICNYYYNVMLKCLN